MADFYTMNNQDYLDVDAAALWIGIRLAKYGRITVIQTKEKWGEARVYVSLGIADLYHVIFPYSSYYYREGWAWLAKIPIPALLHPLILKYQSRVYREVYKRALAKWPNIRDNIIIGSDWPELIENL